MFTGSWHPDFVLCQKDIYYGSHLDWLREWKDSCAQKHNSSLELERNDFLHLLGIAASQTTEDVLADITRLEEENEK